METLTPIAPDSSLLSANLRALARTCPALARRIAEVPARGDVEFLRASDGGVTARLGDGRWLASRHRPIEEGRRFGERADIREHGAIAVAGFGLGHHLRAIAERVGRQGVLIVLEPDLGLLRAVFERVACGSWIDGTHLVLVDRAEEASGITGALSGMEALVAMGLQLLDHPPSSARLGDDASAFARTVTGTLRALRTTIMTTLVQSGTTLRNLVMNADRYATLEGIEGLRGSERGRSAIVISAGPSLAAAMEAMGEEGVRDRFVLIAVQTVLRPLLERGIRPHYVVALDHHEISTRFYEGLSERDVRGVTLVAEAKVNPGVLEAFPGKIRLCADERLDALLGDSRARGALRPGATVAHLAYEFARFLACDPVLLVGQDLAFSDGQYYADGAAIHDTWACELSTMRTLEMFEHERIVRQRHQLIRARDHLGREVYTDEQMHSYLVQFGEMFERDAQRGLTTIDCGEGGLPKAHARREALHDALARYGTPPHAAGIETGSASAGAIDRERAIGGLRERLTRVARDARRIRTLCTRTASLLRSLRERQGDRARAAHLIDTINRCRDEVVSLEPAWELTQFLNQGGALERARADRLLALDTARSALDRQRAQIDRDERNVARMGEAAGALADLLDAGLGVLNGRPRLLRDEPVARGRGRGPRPRVAIIVMADFASGGLGNARAIDHVLADGHTAMSLTLRRAAMSREHDAILVVSDEAERAAGEVRRAGIKAEVIAVNASALRDRARAIAAARVLTPACWRGGLAGMTVHDEVVRPRVLRDILHERSLDAACPIGADWCLVDPALIDGVIARAQGDSLSFVLTQAAPGIAPVLLTRSIIEDLVAQEDRAGPLASVGGVLGYVPDAGRADPIGKDACVRIDAGLRDLHARVIADSPHRQRGIARVLTEAASPESLSGAVLAGALRAYAESCATHATHLTIELCTGRLTSGDRGRWLIGGSEPAERAPMTLGVAAGALARLAAASPDGAVTLAGAGDPLQHPEFDQFVRLARDAGVAGVHVRTDLLADDATVDRLIASPVDIVSVDLMAHDGPTYQRIMGVDGFERARENLERLIAARHARGRSSMPTPWIVPRITRCDAVYGQIEAFYDYWISRLGCCVIDPLPRVIAGERIRPLTIPRSARARLEDMLLRADGTLWRGERAVGPARERSMFEFLGGSAPTRLVA